MFVELFNADVYGNLRRAQGFIRSCTKEINAAGHEIANQHIAAAIATMRRYDKYRVPYFQALLAQARKQNSPAGRDAPDHASPWQSHASLCRQYRALLDLSLVPFSFFPQIGELDPDAGRSGSYQDKVDDGSLVIKRASHNLLQIGGPVAWDNNS